MDHGGLPADASCLIYLARTDTFSLAAQCVPVLVVAPSVWRETVEDGERYGYTDAIRVRDAEEAGSLLREDLDDAQLALAARFSERWRLGRGESETLALASDVGRALVDDGRAARVAAAIGVQPVSTLFLPAMGAMQSLSTGDAISYLRQLAVVMNARAEAVFAVEEFIRRRR
jgi:predicted nucleic acid-binding protein